MLTGNTEKTPLDIDLGEAPRVGTDVGIGLGIILDLGKEPGSVLGGVPGLDTVVGTELGNTPDIGKEAETGAGSSSSGTVSTIGVSSNGSTSRGQIRRRKENPDEMQQKIHHQIQYQHLQVDIQKDQELPRVCLEQDLE